MNQENLGDIFPLVKKWDQLIRQRFLEYVQAPSLTQFLRDLSCVFSVQLTYLGTKKILRDDRIGQELSDQYFVREVSLLLDDVIVVRARSSCLLNSEFWISFLDCGNQPIGEKLINIKNLLRNDFNYGVISRKNPLLKSYTHDDLLYRQSLFEFSDQKLILSECFLASIEQFLS